MRTIAKIFYFIFISLSIISCRQKEVMPSSLIQVKKINYPSASSVEYFNERLYVMGDDATDLLVLDTDLNVLGLKPILPHSDARIPKEIKPDLEASSLYLHPRYESLLLFGSLSTPNRDSFWRYNFKNGEVTSGSLDHLYSKIKTLGIEQVNIEGMCIVLDQLILANRGNKSFPQNYLLIAPMDLWISDTNYSIHSIPVISNTDTANFRGVSGLAYSEKSNQLIMTVSTEDTRSAHEDGTIGKSYLWIVDSISHRLRWNNIKPNRIIDLETIDPRFKGQKIESATVIEETKDSMHLVLVADNDDGSSTIFKISIEKD